MTTLINDIKFGFRILAKRPGFTVTVILVVGLSVGANTAIFNALDQITLRPLPVKQADELVGIQHARLHLDVHLNYPVYEAYRDQADLFSALIAFSDITLQYRRKETIKEVLSLAVSGNYFSCLGITPALGQPFNLKREADTTNHPVVIISDRFRRQEFGNQRDVIGEQLLINDRSLTVMGVMPPVFTGTLVGWVADLYIPLGTYVAIRKDTIHRDTWTWLNVLGRLEPGMNHRQAQNKIGLINQHLESTGLENVPGDVLISDGSRGCMFYKARGFHQPLTLFMIVAAFVLIIATINIAGMQLSRAVSRYKEMAIRQALGAGRWRVIRQLLVESLMLAMAGSLCGMVLAVWFDRLICITLARIGSISMVAGLDLNVLCFALAISLTSGLIFGLAPAWQIIRRHAAPTLKGSTGHEGYRVWRWNPHHLLVVVQVAIAVTILICTTLFLRSMIVLNGIDPGYDTRNLLAVTVGGRTYKQPDVLRFFADLNEHSKGLPGIETFCLSSSIPLTERASQWPISHINGVSVPKDKPLDLDYRMVGPGYFKTLNIPFVNGRDFSERDHPGSLKTLIINDTMARAFWPQTNPLGQQVTLRGGTVVTVIGVVQSAKMRSITEEDQPIAYRPLAQSPQYTGTLLLRTNEHTKSIIPIIWKQAAALRLNRVVHVRTVADHVAGLLFPQHAITLILNAFGLTGLLLCVIGLYSLITFAVKQGTRDIGIRMALGAEARRIVGSVLFKGIILVLTGLAMGLGLSLVALRLLEGQLTGLQKWNRFMLSGVDIWNPSAFIATSLFVILVALLACYIPARRAARIDPMEALRYE